MKNKLKSFMYNSVAPAVGDFLIFLKPEKAKQMSADRINLIHRNKKNMTIPELLMRTALIKKLDKIEDHQIVEDTNKNFWKNNTATELFKELQDGFQKDFLPNCSFIFDLLQQELSNQNNSFLTIVEIGTGNGDVLNWLSSKFPSIQHFIGIDLSERQIKLNNEKFRENKKLEFIATDALDWVKDYGQSHTIFVTSRGVLEYFSESRLQELLIKIHKLGITFFVAIEPNGDNHDFDSNPHSILYGNEPSFSHNYPFLFRNAGFNIWHFSQQPWLGGSPKQTFIGAKNL